MRTAIFVVIPAFNEARAIARVVGELKAAGDLQLVVVDDGSRDDTAGRAQSAGATVLRHAINRGQGAALQTGITFSLQSGAEVIITFDADGQHRVEDLPALVAPIVAGEADFVLGSRFLEHGDAVPRLRRWLLHMAVLFTRATSGMQLSDAHNGLRAFSRQGAERLDLQLDRMAHASELLDQIRASGLPHAEVSVRIRYTPYSVAKGQRSGNAFRIVLEYMLNKILT